MCIRDSRGTGHAGFVQQHVGAFQPFRLRLEEAFLSIVVEGCLLYTSDAADERSSVDLGGRRIIKKKKATDEMINQDRRNNTHVR